MIEASYLCDLQIWFQQFLSSLALVFPQTSLSVLLYGGFPDIDVTLAGHPGILTAAQYISLVNFNYYL